MIAGTRRIRVVIGNDLKPFAATQLPSEFAPEGADLGSVGLLMHAAGAIAGSDKAPRDARPEALKGPPPGERARRQAALRAPTPENR